ncbi:MAG: nitronate monooxygenase, partial [Achromobacter pestifer]
MTLTLPESPACDLLGSTLPIVLAGMGGVARSELVAAVTAAGGFGFLGMVREPPELIRGEVARLRRGGHQRFGVNIIPAATDAALLEQQVATCIALAVPVVGTFWTLDEQVTRRLREAGITVVHQVGSLDEAVAAAQAGVDIIIAQGCEAGGHVRG